MESKCKVKVQVEGGIHARPAAEIVRLSRGFRSEILLESKEQVTSARSSLKLLMLSMKEGDEITMRARGEDASPALASIVGFLEGRGGATNEAPPRRIPDAVPAAAGVLRGIPAGGGPAIGEVFAFIQPELDREAPAVSPTLKAERLDAAVAAVFSRIRAEAESAGNLASREILAALAELADDPDWSADMRRAVSDGRGALAAVQETGAALAAAIALEDPYASARAEDMRRRWSFRASGRQDSAMLRMDP